VADAAPLEAAHQLPPHRRELHERCLPSEQLQHESQTAQLAVHAPQRALPSLLLERLALCLDLAEPGAHFPPHVGGQVGDLLLRRCRLAVAVRGLGHGIPARLLELPVAHALLDDPGARRAGPVLRELPAQLAGLLRRVPRAAPRLPGEAAAQGSFGAGQALEWVGPRDEAGDRLQEAAFVVEELLAGLEPNGLVVLFEGAVEGAGAAVAAGLIVQEGDEDVAARTVLAQVLGEGEERRAVGRAARAGRQAWHLAEGVEVRRDDEDLLLVLEEGGLGALDEGEDVASRGAVPGNGAVDDGLRAFRQVGARAGVVEAGQVGVGDRVVGVPGLGGAVGHEDGRLRPEAEGADPAAAAVVVQHHDAAAWRALPEVLRVARPRVQELAPDALGRAHRRHDAVRPHRQELQLPAPCLDDAPGDLRLRTRELLDEHVVGADLPEPPLDILRRGPESRRPAQPMGRLRQRLAVGPELTLAGGCTETERDEEGGGDGTDRTDSTDGTDRGAPPRARPDAIASGRRTRTLQRRERSRHSGCLPRPHSCPFVSIRGSVFFCAICAICGPTLPRRRWSRPRCGPRHVGRCARSGRRGST